MQAEEPASCNLIEAALPAVLEISTNPESFNQFNDPASWDSLSGGGSQSHSVGSDMLESSSGTLGTEWFQSGWTLDQPTMLGLGHHSDVAPWSPFATPTPTDSNISLWAAGNTAGSSTQGATQSATYSNNTILAGQQLTCLVSQIQQQLQKLQESPWHTDSTCSLNEYPVGTILGLAEQFSAISGSILGCSPVNRDPCVDGGVEVDSVLDEDDITPRGGGGGGSSKTTSATEDTPIILLIMCGYVWLVRIYAVVLDHFQKHLKNRFASRHRRLIGLGSAGSSSNNSLPLVTDSSTGTTLRLGELPCADAAINLQQINTAVRMLLDAMQDIEGHLGRGATVVRAMAVALLLKPGRCEDDSSAVLDKQATAVKELLRERMFL
jgi:hypothetical protein